jgi:hypothetical protein
MYLKKLSTVYGLIAIITLNWQFQLMYERNWESTPEVKQKKTLKYRLHMDSCLLRNVYNILNMMMREGKSGTFNQVYDQNDR